MMKTNVILLGCMLVLSFLACEKSETLLSCEGDCLFLLENVEGEIIRMECFERFAIQTSDPDQNGQNIYGIPNSLKSKFNEAGMKVTFSASFRENQLTPNFPDPSFNPGSIYQIEVFDIK